MQTLLTLVVVLDFQVIVRFRSGKKTHTKNSVNVRLGCELRPAAK